ncbi:hypothetical protein V1522DRAFT_396348 [Lipomyces starkeyi]
MHLTYRDDNKNIMKGGYKLCNFWSNLDIGSLKFWRLQAYRYFIGFLDRTGTFLRKVQRYVCAFHLDQAGVV